MNKVILLGRLTKDVELRTTPSGMVVGKFTLAVNRKKDSNGEQKADFLNCTTFGKSAEALSKYCKKGSQLLVSDAEININNYTDKEGKQRQSVDIVVRSFEFIGGGNSSASKQTQPQAQAQQTNNDGFMNIPSGLEDELPFA